MNRKILTFIKNFSYALSSNLINLIVSVLVVLIVPKIIGVQDYSYWQLYVFYSSYVGFFYFGWADGIYLRYGGKHYEELSKKRFFSQFVMLCLFEFVIGIIILLFSIFFIQESNRQFIISMVSINLFIVCCRAMPIFILQATNRIKEFSYIMMIDRALYVVLLTLSLILGFRDYKLNIILDILAKGLSFIYAVYVCRELFIHKFSTFRFDFKETAENISVGIKLMFSNIASMLIIGIIRFGVEHNWDIITFGKLSLSLSISNFIMIFISAVGVVMFPALKQTDETKLPMVYTFARDSLMIIIFAVLLLMFPVREVLSIWLPQYAESIQYIALLFPMLVFESKMAILINTYLNALRKEKIMLFINVLSLLFSLIVTAISVYLLHNLTLTILNIIIAVSFRCLIAEIYLSRTLHIHIIRDSLIEIVLVVIFILTSWFLPVGVAITFYALSYGIYLFLKRKGIKRLIKLSSKAFNDRKSLGS